MSEAVMSYASGRHFLQIPGPTNVPDRVLRAIDRATIDHRGPDFGPLGLAVVNGLKRVFKTEQPVIVYPSSGTGAWEAALVNTLSAGDLILSSETGQFAALWAELSRRMGLNVEVLETGWRKGADPEAIEARLSEDREHSIKAVCVVHNETSTGVVSRIADVRRAMDRAGHPALLIVDTISSLGSIDFRMDEWGVDVGISGSQKGLMLPPGLSFNAVSEKALAASSKATLPRSYWRWDDMLISNKTGYFPYTPATNLLYGLREALLMLEEEGLERVFARHTRHATAARAAVASWGLEIVCQNPAEYSSVLTAVLMPEGHDADVLRSTILDAYDMSLGTGLGRFARKIFRIGHLGHFNDLTLAGTLAGVEMGLKRAGVPHTPGGVQAAMEVLAD
jgi:alanine-glyoxylate transaminase/serine-glyoxylate transaminase/serine-pyruvate transaminase